MTDDQLRQFLLRRLPADDAARVEDAILMKDGFAERLRDAEFDLLDDYAACRLNAADAADLERYLLDSADKIHSLKVARALQGQRAPGVDRPTVRLQSLDRPRARMPPIVRVATLLAACLVAVVVIPRWLPVPVRPDVALTGSDAQRSPASGVSAERFNAGSAMPIVSLLADVNRGSVHTSLKIAVGAPAVRLQAEVPASSPDTRFNIRIDDAQGQRLFEGANLSARTAGPYRFVEAVVPTSALGFGERMVRVTQSGVSAESPAAFRWQITVVADSRP